MWGIVSDAADAAADAASTIFDAADAGSKAACRHGKEAYGAWVDELFSFTQIVKIVNFY